MGTVGNLMRMTIAAVVSGLIVALALAAVAQANHPGPPSGDGVQPVFTEGNLNCAGLDPGKNELRIEPPADGTYSDDDGPLTVTIDVRDTPNGPVFDWTANIGVDSVFVKGGPDGNFYRYDPPAENSDDTSLHSPVNHSNDTFFGLSHISFCYDADEDEEGTLTVIKHVVNDDGGSATAANWTINVSGPTSLSFPGAESPGTTNTVDAGSYTVTESGGPSGYSLTYSGDCDANGNVTVGENESKTCTLTNNDQPAPPQPANLIVKKVVINDNGGTKQAQDFSFSVNGGAAQAFDPDGQNDLVVNAGSYDVTEPPVAGYTTSYQNCANIQLPPGGTATCTITNDDTAAPPQPATLIVKKVVVNDNGGTKQAQNFTFSVNGGAAQAFEPDGQNNLSVPAGTYSVTEPAVAGYSTTYNNCSNLVIPAGGSATCTITNNDVAPGVGAISVSKSASPTSLQEPGGQVTYSVRITNTSVDVDVSITSVVDDRFGDLDDEGGNGCFDVPINLAPGQFASCQFTRQITGAGGTSHVNTVTGSGHDEKGNPVSGSDDARVDITPRLIDLVVVKDATSPTQLNGTVTYTMTVTNKGPDTATNVQLADPAPAGITYLSANPSQGTCSVGPALITCSLGTIAAGQRVTITVTGRATQVGSHTNTATVTGSGGRETNPADNVDSAVTAVPAPLKPPTATPKPTPKPEVCLTVTVTPKMIKADGKMDTLAVKVTAAGKRVKGAKVLVKGAGIRKASRTNGKGIAIVRINAKRPGLVTITTLERQKVCGAKRIGVVGIFLPPVTG
jgi:uncharacterized repeat protein (TIGR01451 family)